MTLFGQIVATAVLAYLIGAIPFGYLIARWHGVDLFKHGSGNIGATNVGRVLGWQSGILVFLLDFAKGAGPVLLAQWLAKVLDSNAAGQGLPVAAGLAAFAGHIFPIYLHFRGGKGVATGAGVVAVLLPWPALAALVTWIAVLMAWRYVSLASLAAVVALCAVYLATTPQPFTQDHLVLTLFCFVAAALVIIRHRTNIARLIHGTENRLQETRIMLTLSKTIHVLALGLWFGSGVFFTFVAAPLVFQSFESMARSPADRPAWLADNFDKEKATQLAGIAVGPIFPWYFLLQGICACLALATAYAWTRSQPHVGLHKLRFYLLALALAMILAGWPIAQKVSGLRAARYAADSAIATAARADFATWHLISLMLNIMTVLAVTIAMALAARMPNERGSAEPIGRKQTPSQEETANLPITNQV
jgi:acyl phosphate:glycerol-3-phosphate acyltransferase